MGCHCLLHLCMLLGYIWGFPGGSVGKNPPANAGDIEDLRSILGKITWKRKWKPTPVFYSWKILWTGKPGKLQSIEVAKSWTQPSMCVYTYTHTTYMIYFFSNQIRLLSPYRYWGEGLAEERQVTYLDSTPISFYFYLLFTLL